MAVTILTEPNSPQYSISDIVYVVESDQRTQAEFNYVADISIGTEFITRLSQVTSPSGFGEFNLSRIIDDLLEFDTNAYGENNTNSTNSTKDITISFRERFLTTDGVSRLTEPTATSTVRYIKGVKVFSNELGETISGLLSSRLDEYNVRADESLSISYYGEFDTIQVESNGITDTVAFSGTANSLRHIGIGLPQILSYTTQFASIPTINSYTVTLNENNPVTTAASDTFSGTGVITAFRLSFIPISGTITATINGVDNTGFTVSGNTITFAPAPPSGTDNVVVSYSYAAANLSPIETFNVTVDHERERSITRFAWQNDTGGLDYFTANQEHTRAADIDNRTYTVNPIIVSSAGSARTHEPLNANVLNRANQVYRKSFNENFVANTRWLTDQEAAMIEGLFDSRSTYIQVGNIFHPIVVTNNSRQTRIHNRESVLFQYEIQYQLSNNKRSV